MTSFHANHDGPNHNGSLSSDPQHEQTWDSVETYFQCITTCSLDDGECVTRCVEQLRDSDS